MQQLHGEQYKYVIQNSVFFFFIFQFSLEFVYSICNGFILKLPKLEWSAKSSHCLWIELTSGSLVLGAHNTWISHVSMFIIVLLAVIFESLFCSCIVFFIMLMIFQMDAVWIYNRNFLHYLFFSPQRWLDNFSTWCYYTMNIIVWRQSFHCFNHSIRFWIFFYSNSFFTCSFNLIVNYWNSVKFLQTILWFQNNNIDLIWQKVMLTKFAIKNTL